MAEANKLELGAFSMSLNVEDLEKSRTFYEVLGFSKFGGDEAQNYLIMKNGDHLIGLFKGVIPKNTITFNPGWDQDAKEVQTFTDVREIQKRLDAAGLKLDSRVDESAEGPGHIMLTDPDGNPILIDQFI